VSKGNAEIDFFLIKNFRSQRNESHQFSHAINHFKSKLKHFRRIEELDLELVEEQQLSYLGNGFRAKTIRKTQCKARTYEARNSVKESFE
jgi:hypothetical protein